MPSQTVNTPCPGVHRAQRAQLLAAVAAQAAVQQQRVGVCHRRAPPADQRALHRPPHTGERQSSLFLLFGINEHHTQAGCTALWACVLGRVLFASARPAMQPPLRSQQGRSPSCCRWQPATRRERAAGLLSWPTRRLPPPLGRQIDLFSCNSLSIHSSICGLARRPQVKVKRRGSDTKYVAKVLAMGVECDIALLTGGERRGAPGVGGEARTVVWRRGKGRRVPTGGGKGALGMGKEGGAGAGRAAGMRGAVAAACRAQGGRSPALLRLTMLSCPPLACSGGRELLGGPCARVFRGPASASRFCDGHWVSERWGETVPSLACLPHFQGQRGGRLGRRTPRASVTRPAGRHGGRGPLPLALCSVPLISRTCTRAWHLAGTLSAATPCQLPAVGGSEHGRGRRQRGHVA